MTVAELIDKLRAMPQDMRVVVNNVELQGYDEPELGEAWADLSRENNAGYLSRYDEARGRMDGEEVGTLVVVISGV